MVDYSQKLHNGTSETSDGLAAIQAQLNNLGRESRTLADLGAIVSVMPFSTYTKLGLGELAPTKLIVELADRTVKRPKGRAENVLVGINKFVFLVDFIVVDMPEDSKTPLILGRPFLSTTHAKIDMFKRKITLRIGNDKVVSESVMRIVHTVHGDGVAIIKRWRQDLHRDGVRDLATASGRDRLKEDIESSMRRQ
ncbi:zinc finger, CCHC-type containing protein, partial [Tanacetum coccineum]